jgi:hypothetical protein
MARELMAATEADAAAWTLSSASMTGIASGTPFTALPILFVNLRRSVEAARRGRDDSTVTRPDRRRRARPAAVRHRPPGATVRPTSCPA